MSRRKNYPDLSGAYFKGAEIASKNAYINNLAKSQEAQSELRKQKLGLEKQKQDFDIAMKVLKDVSAKFTPVNDPNGEKWALFKQTDHYRELTNFFKKKLPNQFDDNGDLILIDNQSLLKEQIANRKEMLRLKIASGQATPAEIQEGLRFASLKDSNLLAQATDLAMASDSWTQSNPVERQKLIASNYNDLVQGQIQAMGGAPQEQAPPDITAGEQAPAQGNSMASMLSGAFNRSNPASVALDMIKSYMGSSNKAPTQPSSNPATGALSQGASGPIKIPVTVGENQQEAAPQGVMPTEYSKRDPNDPVIRTGFDPMTGQRIGKTKSGKMVRM